MARTFEELTPDEWHFLTERRVATLTTVRSDGRPHVVAIAFTIDRDDGVVRIITSERTQKVRNIEGNGQGAVAQVDGPSWLSLQGRASVVREPAGIRRAVAEFERRYRPARANPHRVAIEIADVEILGAVRLPG